MKRLIQTLIIFFALSNTCVAQSETQSQFSETVTISQINSDLEAVNSVFIPPPPNVNFNFEDVIGFEIEYDDDVPLAFRQAIEFAVCIWDNALDITIPITIRIRFNDLGAAGPVLFIAAATLTNTKKLKVDVDSEGNVSYDPENGQSFRFPHSLANQLQGFDTSNNVDIRYTISSNANLNWYTLIDGLPGNNQNDLVSLSLHEIGHGLGFSAQNLWIPEWEFDLEGTIDITIPIPGMLITRNSYFNTFVQVGDLPGGDNYREVDGMSSLNVAEGGNLFWNGQRATEANQGNMPPIFAPNPYMGGSSISHFDETWAAGLPNLSINKPISILGTAVHSPNNIDMGLLADLGWGINCIFEGCTDSEACNFDPIACSDDFSCEYKNWYYILTPGGLFYDWREFCGLTPNAPTFDYFGTIYSIGPNQECVRHVMESLGEDACASTTWYQNGWDDCQLAYDCCIDPQYNGCTDPEACNFDPDACYDDGTCLNCWVDEWIEQSCFNLSISPYQLSSSPSGEWFLFDTYGTLQEWGSYSFSMFDTSPIEFIDCLPGCYTFEVEPDNILIGDDIFWSIDYGGISYSGNSNTTPIALVFPPNAMGCTDPTACNYDATACGDDGSCIYQQLSWELVDLMGTTWNTTIDAGCNLDVDANFTITFNYDYSFTTSTGYQGDWTACDGALTLYWYNGAEYNGDVVDGQISGTFNIPDSPIYGCFTMNADAGCTSPYSCNYDSTALINDGSCITCGDDSYSCFNLTIYPLPEGLTFKSGYWSLIGLDGIEETGSYSFNPNLNDPIEYYFCVPPGCYTFEVEPDNPYINEGLFWSIDFEDTVYSGNTDDDAEIYSFSTGCTDPTACNYDPAACYDDNNCIYLQIGDTLDNLAGTTWSAEIYPDCDGPMDFGYRIDFFSDQTFINNENGITGTWTDCNGTVTLVLNSIVSFVSTASSNDEITGNIWYVDGFGSTSEEGCFTLKRADGCTDSAACNFDPIALEDDGSCTQYDACGECNEGGALSYCIEGCTDTTACNYNSNAAVDDGSCTFPGCPDPISCNYLASAGCTEACIYPSNQILGCTYPSADNYDPLNNVDDGTCIFVPIDQGACGPGTYFDEQFLLCLPDGTGTEECPGDLDNDGFIITNDLLLFLAAFGSACP